MGTNLDPPSTEARQQPGAAGSRENPVSSLRHRRLVSLFQSTNGSWTPLATVVGFAGSGKTEALRALADRFGHRSAYLALETTDRFPAQLLGRLRSTIAESHVPRRGGWILIDDFHIIDCSASVDTMSELLRRIPPGVSVAIASRTTPDLRRAGHMIGGEVVQIDERHLALTCSDLVPLLQIQPGPIETLDLAARLWRLTAGWPAVIEMLSQLAAHRPPTQLTASAGHRPWTALIEEEVIRSLQPLTQTVLPALAETNGLTISELGELVGADLAKAVIADLERTRLIDCTALTAEVMRLHPLLTDHICRNDTVDRLPNHEQLFDWYQRTDRPLEAALLAAQTGVSEHLIEALTNDWSRIADHADDQAIQELLDRSNRHSPLLPKGAKRGLKAIQRHRTRLFALTPKTETTEQPDRSGPDSIDPGDAVLAVNDGEIGRATEIRTRLKTEQSEQIPALTRAHFAAIPLWNCQLQIAEQNLLSLSRSLESPPPLAAISLYGHLAVVYLEQNQRMDARRAAGIAGREAEIAGLEQHPESCLATLVNGSLDNDRSLLERAAIISSGAGAVRTAYCSLVFITIPAVADSILIEPVRRRVFGLMETMIDPGSLVGDRWRRFAPSERRRRYGAGLLAEPLTQREMDQLRYLPSDLNQRSIALRMGVSRNTVKTNNRAIYRKLGVRSRQEAVSTAQQVGLL